MQVMEVTSLSNDELQEQLIKHGMKPGPIVATTRGVYEKKLLMLMGQGPAVPQVKQNGTGDLDQYSDSEEEEHGYEEQMETENVVVTNRSRTNNSGHNRVTRLASNALDYSNATVHAESTFSIAKMVEQLEKKSADPASSADSSSPQGYHRMQADSSFQKGDLLNELFPDEQVSPTGISATRRKPIKGAAGRPIQFTHENFLTRVRPVERVNVGSERMHSQQIVPAWAKVLVFIIFVFVLYLIYQVMEVNEENPFTNVVDQSNVPEPEAQPAQE